jgi:hypothetical protein
VLLLLLLQLLMVLMRIMATLLIIDHAAVAFARQTRPLWRRRLPEL